MNYII